MKETNDYGMYSGAFIFDAMDRAALDYVRKESGLPADAVIVTQYVNNLEFKRQLCEPIFRVECYGFEDIFKNGHSIWCHTRMRDKTGEPIATATFQFTTATNHCELERKERKNENTIHNDKWGVSSSN